MRGYNNQFGTAAFCHPNGVPRSDAAGLGSIIFGQNNAVPRLLVPAYSYRFPPQLRVLQALPRCIKIVAIHMQYSSHSAHL